MSASNFRIKEYDTVHHLVSRIAHKVFFLGDEERNDFTEMMRRAAAFGGLRLLGWCIMSNHFHILVYLPPRVEVNDDEVMRRVGILKGDAGRRVAEMQLAQWRAQGDEKRVNEWFDRQRARMFDIGEFMKIVKQWFTEDYNRREAHVGTLWESVYHDHPIPMRVKDMSRVLGYIHLNPFRAAACAGYAEYQWSSFSALAKGDALALNGIRFVYDDPQATAADLAERHTALLDVLLEDLKRRRAEEIALRRRAGFQVPSDPITSEAMVAQAAAHLDEVMRASMVLRESDSDESKNRYSRGEIEAKIAKILSEDPLASVEKIALETSLKSSSVYERLRIMRKSGIIRRESRTSPWIVKGVL